MPIDLGAKGSCQIGGNISTNAGGLRLLRYGSLHGSVLGLEVVLADGTILDMLSVNRKDNTGYALKHLFVGAEGTLGVVTRCSLAVPPKPSNVCVVLLACANFTGVERVLALARRRLGEVLSAAEFMDKESVALTLEKCEGVRSPFLGGGGGGDGDRNRGESDENGGDESGQQHSFYVLLETSGSEAKHDEEKLDDFLCSAMESVSLFWVSSRSISLVFGAEFIDNSLRKLIVETKQSTLDASEFVVNNMSIPRFVIFPSFDRFFLARSLSMVAIWIATSSCCTLNAWKVDSCRHSQYLQGNSQAR